ncbi:unnamed protein product [marine sediment metagenome]|uniref:Uncharacterized protein n=1 Tax=marine sediment metagenome TaxID=412755 RepID=X0VSD7_9ZZZZ
MLYYAKRRGDVIQPDENAKDKQESQIPSVRSEPGRSAGPATPAPRLTVIRPLGARGIGIT